MIAAMMLAALMVQAGPKPVLERWTGRVDASAASAAPDNHVVASASELATLWKAWQVRARLPNVDFSRNLVLVHTGRSSVLQLRSVAVDAAGDLKAVIVATPDMTADYAFIIAVVDRAGVKSVHGTRLPDLLF